MAVKPIPDGYHAVTPYLTVEGANTLLEFPPVIGGDHIFQLGDNGVLKAINKHTGRSEGLPEIVSRGFMSMDESSEVLHEARQIVMKTLDTSTAEERTDWGVMQEKIRADLKRYLIKQTSRRPLIMPVILEV